MFLLGFWLDFGWILVRFRLDFKLVLDDFGWVLGGWRHSRGFLEAVATF